MDSSGQFGLFYVTFVLLQWRTILGLSGKTIIQSITFSTKLSFQSHDGTTVRFGFIYKKDFAMWKIYIRKIRTRLEVLRELDGYAIKVFSIQHPDDRICCSTYPLLWIRQTLWSFSNIWSQSFSDLSFHLRKLSAENRKLSVLAVTFLSENRFQEFKFVLIPGKQTCKINFKA